MHLARSVQGFVMAAALSLLAGCGGEGGSDDGGGGSDSTRIGVLTDAAVGGVPYTATPSGLNGVTNAQGEYEYEPGDSITFTLAGLTFTVAATGEISPATIAAELFPEQGDAATLNLSILFQSLDSDGNPDNGIIVAADAALAGEFDLASELGKDPAGFAASLAGHLPDGYAVADPQEAFEHFYGTQLAGNWRAVEAVLLKDGGVDIPGGQAIDLQEDLQIGFVLSFDSRGRFAYTTWDLTIEDVDSPRRADAAVGEVAYDTGENGLPVASLQGIDRPLNGNPISATDPDEDLFGATVRLVGNSLVVSIPGDNAATVTYVRMNNVKDSLTGGWARAGDFGDAEFGVIDEDGNRNFGPRVDGLFVYFLEEGRLLLVTLDIDPTDEGTGDFRNGVAFMAYDEDHDGIEFTEELADTSATGETPSLDAGGRLDYVSSLLADTERVLGYSGSSEDPEELLEFWRALSNGERLTEFLVVSSAPMLFQLEYTVYATTVGDEVPDKLIGIDPESLEEIYEGFFCTPPEGEIGEEFTLWHELVFYPEEGKVRVTTPTDEGFSVVFGNYNPETGSVSWVESEQRELTREESGYEYFYDVANRRFHIQTEGNFSGVYDSQDGTLTGSMLFSRTMGWNKGNETVTCTSSTTVSGSFGTSPP